MLVTKKTMMRFENHDTELFDKFFKSYSGLVYYYVNKCNIFDEDADDCVQEIFTNLIRSHNTYKYFKGNFTAWLFHITELHTKFFIDYDVSKKSGNTLNKTGFKSIDDDVSKNKRIHTKLEQYLGEIDYAIMILKTGFNLKWKQIKHILNMGKIELIKRYVSAQNILRKFKRGS